MRFRWSSTVCVVPSYLCVAVVERHQGGVDNLSVGVGRLAFPVSDWMLGVNPVMQFLSAPAPQHHLQTQNSSAFLHQFHDYTNFFFHLYKQIKYIA